MTESSTATPGYVVTLLRGRVYHTHGLRFEAGVPQVVVEENIVEELLDDEDVVSSPQTGEVFSVARFDVKYYADIAEVANVTSGDSDKTKAAKKARSEKLAALKSGALRKKTVTPKSDGTGGEQAPPLVSSRKTSFKSRVNTTAA